MAKMNRTSAEIPAEQSGETDFRAESIRRMTVPEPFPRPQVYSGSQSQSVDIPAPLQRNRRIVKRRASPFTIIILLLGAAVAIVLYISNIIAVDQLMGEINTLEIQHRRILMEQEILKARMNRMASLERIQELAEKDLGLETSKEPPVWLSVDPDRVKELQQP